jgi:hypothetical protein
VKKKEAIKEERIFSKKIFKKKFDEEVSTIEKKEIAYSSSLSPFF